MRRLVWITSIAIMGVAGIGWAKTPFVPIPPTVPRPAGEEIPATARTLKISWTQPGRKPILITNRTRIRRIAHVIDELPVEGSGVCSEGLITGPPTISFDFLRSRTGPVLATARQAAQQVYGLAWCVPTLFDVRHHRRLHLEGGSYLIKQAAKILHRNLSQR